MSGTIKETLIKAALFLWMAVGLCYVFLKLPAAEGFANPELARMVTLHLPCAYVAVILAFVSGWHAIAYLRKREMLSDGKATAAAALAALFCLLTTVTGSFFAKVQWGDYWNWDPRQTSVFLLLLIYAAYFVLRASIEDEEKRAAVSAVYMLFAVVMTPLLGYFIPKAMPQSLHPKMASFDSHYRIAIYICILPPQLYLTLWLHGLSVRIEKLRLAAQERLELS
jgi:heme exporter protein C